MDYCIWMLTRPDEAGSEPEIFTSERVAMETAEKIVGNRSYSVAGNGEFILYGPGNGDTSVLIRRITREFAEKFGFIKPSGG